MGEAEESSKENRGERETDGVGEEKRKERRKSAREERREEGIN